MLFCAFRMQQSQMELQDKKWKLHRTLDMFKNAILPNPKEMNVNRKYKVWFYITEWGEKKIVWVFFHVLCMLLCCWRSFIYLSCSILPRGSKELLWTLWQKWRKSSNIEQFTSVYCTAHTDRVQAWLKVHYINVP